MYWRSAPGDEIRRIVFCTCEALGGSCKIPFWWTDEKQLGGSVKNWKAKAISRSILGSPLGVENTSENTYVQIAHVYPWQDNRIMEYQTEAISRDACELKWLRGALRCIIIRTFRFSHPRTWPYTHAGKSSIRLQHAEILTWIGYFEANMVAFVDDRLRKTRSEHSTDQLKHTAIQ